MITDLNCSACSWSQFGRMTTLGKLHHTHNTDLTGNENKGGHYINQIPLIWKKRCLLIHWFFFCFFFNMSWTVLKFKYTFSPLFMNSTEDRGTKHFPADRKYRCLLLFYRAGTSRVYTIFGGTLNSGRDPLPTHNPLSSGGSGRWLWHL